MTLNQYQNEARRTHNPALSRDSMESHALHGLASEVGELHGIYQKYYQGHSRSYSEVVFELGDILWFLAEFADSIGIQLGTIAEINIEKLKKRYPNGFDAKNSLNREKEAHDEARQSI